MYYVNLLTAHQNVFPLPSEHTARLFSILPCSQIQPYEAQEKGAHSWRRAIHRPGWLASNCYRRETGKKYAQRLMVKSDGQWFIFLLFILSFFYNEDFFLRCEKNNFFFLTQKCQEKENVQVSTAGSSLPWFFSCQGPS